MMSPGEFVFRVILALIFPPLGGIGLNKVGCGTILLLLLLTLLGYFPGVIVAIVLLIKEYSDSGSGRS